MKFKHHNVRTYHCKKILLTIAFLIFMSGNLSNACTGIRLYAENGAVVYGRTMEWGAFDWNSRVVVIPRGYSYTGLTPDGKPGKEWTAKYGFVGLDMAGEMMIADGMNEKGLAAGAFYHKGFADYADYIPEKADQTISAQDIIQYILSRFATIDEVKEGLEKIRIVGVEEEVLGIPVYLHCMLTDPSGALGVIEFTNKETVFHDNRVGVITNNPNFDWHVTNLRNYINITPKAFAPQQWGDTTMGPLGGGSGFLGLPGDFTPPSRFVRAACFAQTARETTDGPDTVEELFRILDNFNVPLGFAEGSDDSNIQSQMKSATLWTTAWDTRNLAFYYHTQYNRRIRMLQFSELDFEPVDMKPIYYPMDLHQKEDVQNVLMRE